VDDQAYHDNDDHLLFYFETKFVYLASQVQRPPHNLHVLPGVQLAMVEAAEIHHFPKIKNKNLFYKNEITF